MADPIDLSKYAAGNPFKVGDRVRFAGHDDAFVVAGAAPNSIALEGRFGWFSASRFVPVEDEAQAIVCLCSPEHCDGINQLCPEHGRRCSDPNCDRLSAGPREWLHYQGRKKLYYCNDGCMRAHHHVAPPVAEIAKPSSCTRCGLPRSLPGGLCADCELLEGAKAPCGCNAGCLGFICGFKPVTAKLFGADPYKMHAERLENMGLLNEQGVAQNTDLHPRNERARRRIAVLRLELDTPLSARRLALAKKYGAREVDDWSVFSTATDES